MLSCKMPTTETFTEIENYRHKSADIGSRADIEKVCLENYSIEREPDTRSGDKMTLIETSIAKSCCTSQGLEIRPVESVAVPSASDETIAYFIIGKRGKLKGQLTDDVNCGGNEKVKNRRRRDRSVASNSSTNLSTSGTGKKWRRLSPSETNFNLSLLPRRSNDHLDTDCETELDHDIKDPLAIDDVTIDNEISMGPGAESVNAQAASSSVAPVSENSVEVFDTTTCLVLQCEYFADYNYFDDGDGFFETDIEKYENRSPVVVNDEGIAGGPKAGASSCVGCRQRLRQKKKWRVEKARLQLKTKNCRTVSNTVHGVALYVNHRVVKCMLMVVGGREARCRQPKQSDADQRAVVRIKCQPSNAGNRNRRLWTNKCVESEIVDENGMPINLLYAVGSQNADSSLSTEVVSLLLALQHRDLDPNDYDLLLQLDERVKPRTVDESQLSQLRVAEVVPADLEYHDIPPVCGVCLEPYELGNRRKFLPCEHSFHELCIDSWLRASSANCPLDGLPIV